MSFEYQLTVNAFSVDDFSVGPLSFPQETFDVIYSQPLALDVPVPGIAYNVHNGQLDFFFTQLGGPIPYLIFYPPGVKPLMDPAQSQQTLGLFDVTVFTHPEYGQLYVGGTITQAAAVQTIAVSAAEPAMLPLLLLGLALAALVAKHRAHMTEREI